MMIGYILLTLLLLEIWFFYILNGKNIVSTSFIATAVFILSVTIYLFAENDYYQYHISIETAGVIALLLLCISIGENVANRQPKNRTIKAQRNFNRDIILSIPTTIFLSLFVLTFGLIYFFEVYIYSLTAGNFSGNYAGMTMYVRDFGGYSKSLIVSHGTLVSESILYFCVYCICFNISTSDFFYKRYLFPIICYIPHILASDNRTGLLKVLIVSGIIVFVFMKERNNWGKGNNAKIIKISVTILILFLIAFRMLGYRTGTSVRNALWDNITEYTSASLVGLDKYLINGEENNIIFGQATLKNIYATLREWGIPIPNTPKFEFFFTYFGGRSNIYTAFKAYIKDYTIIGAMVAMFLWGYVTTSRMNYIRRNGASFVRLVFLGLIYYPVAMISIEDTTASFLCMPTVYMFIYLHLIQYIFIKCRLGRTDKYRGELL